MSLLIVRDKDGLEVCTREMDPAERYTFYTAQSEGELVSFGGKRYKLHSVAWQKPEQNCVLLVSFDSYEPVAPTDVLC